ncbi:Porin [Gammaproteobacteria bacterium]
MQTCKITLSILTFSTLVAVADEVPNFSAETLTGGWGGSRAALYEKGLTLSGGYKSDFLRIIDGRPSGDGHLVRHLEIGLKADLGKLWGWQDTTLFLDFIDDRGDRFNADHVGSALGVSNIEVGHKTAKLFHAWVQKEWDEGRWSLLTGLYPLDSEFMVIDSDTFLISPAYGMSPELAMTNLPSAFNNSTVGGRLKWLSPEKSFYMQLAVVNGIGEDPEKLSGTHVQFGHGVLSMLEVGYHPPTTGPAEDFQKYALGTWAYSAKDTLSTPVNERQRWGAYLQGERTLLNVPSLGELTTFARHGGAFGGSSTISHTTSVGLRLHGLATGNDVAGVAHTRAKLIGLEAESAWEVTYRIQVNPWLGIQPNWQRIQNLGGISSAPAVSIAGFRIDVLF